MLSRGEINVLGRMPWSSNVTLLAEITLDGRKAFAIYKPERGERPLWDFPSGLHRREIGAYILSEALGWGLVPLTLPREGPYGEGSLQLFIDADFEKSYFELRADRRNHDQLRRMCAFDLIANNADRKAGHCLIARDGTVFGIDNGLCFHEDPKLRTVIWDFAGEELPAEVCRSLARLTREGLPEALACLLTEEERQALLARAESLLGHGQFPDDRGGYRHPWPPV